MRKAMSIMLVLVLALSGSAFARPVDQMGSLDKLQQLDLSGTAKEFVGASNPGVFGAAVAGTVFFGGTVWAADSARWEALDPGSGNHVWTFDSGVGSNIKGAGAVAGDPEVNEFKPAGFHGRMNGWVGIDNTFSKIPYFRRCFNGIPASTEFGTHNWGTVCVGSTAGLGGTYSMWAGVFKDEADALCYVGGQGYGNSWVTCIEHPFTYTGGGVTLGFMYKNDTEQDYDYTVVYVDTTGTGKDVEAASYTGTASGTASVALAQGTTLPVIPKPIKIKFCVQSDGSYSDQDGLNPTPCGAFAVDNISVSGGGIAHTANFETNDGGWVRSSAAIGQGGEWSNLYALTALPAPLTPCACDLADSVLAFPDANNGHNKYTDNIAASPWCDLKAAGVVGAPGKIIRTNLYAELPLRNYVFVQFNAQWYPEVCLNTGKLYVSPFTSNGFVYYFGGVPQCSPTTVGSRGTQIDFSAVIPAGAEQVRIALGALSYCRFYANCTNVSNTTPWFDNAALGVYGQTGGPYIFSDVIDFAQDNFPEDGTLNVTSPGRVDCNNVKGAASPEVGTTLGDTLVIRGAVGGYEVWTHFRVTPGPGTAANPAYAAWFTSHAVSDVAAEAALGFRMARCDTAEQGASGPISGAWMTAYHEADPIHGNLAAVANWDRQLDPSDIAPAGGNWRLLHDIYPDNLFTPGTTIEMFNTANAVGVPNPKYRDPAVGYYEMQILPSSMNAGGNFNCVLYVDHFNRGAQVFIEGALTTIVGPNNWDRFDVNAESSQQLSFGRPLQTEYGATVPQTIGYKAILWDSGNLSAYCLTREDADVLNPFLTLQGFNNRNLYLSGDGVAFAPIAEAESEPSAGSATGLIQKLVGVKLNTACAAGTFRNAGCSTPSGGPLALQACVELNPIPGAPVSNLYLRPANSHWGQGNGCPQLRSFDVFALTNTPNFGLSKGEEEYKTTTLGAKVADYASASNDGAYIPNPNGLTFKTVIDGVSVHYRRASSGTCDFAVPPGDATPVTERIREVFTYFGYNSVSNPLCQAPAGSTGLVGNEGRQPKFRTSLADFAPNPLVTGAAGRIQFTVAREGRATIDVFDIQGRLVKSVFKGVAQEGINEAFWNGTDEAGTQVASGVYFYRLRSGDEDLSKKMVVVRNGGN